MALQLQVVAPYCCYRKLAMYIRGRLPLERNCILLCQGQLLAFRFSLFRHFHISYFHTIRTMATQSEQKVVVAGIFVVRAHLSRCSFLFFSCSSFVRVRLAPGDSGCRMLSESISCSLYGNKCQTSVSPEPPSPAKGNWFSLPLRCLAGGRVGVGSGARLGHLAISASASLKVDIFRIGGCCGCQLHFILEPPTKWDSSSSTQNRKDVAD